MNKKLVFFGTEEFSARFLQAIISADYEVAAVITKPDTKKGRGQKLHTPLVKTIAQQHSIPVWQPIRLQDCIDNIRSLGNTCGILVSYGKIIPQSVIDCFTPGIINVHPSLLPKYRGPSPVETTILNGDHIAGISIMQLSKAMDAGPVYSQVTTSLHGAEQKDELYQTLGDIAENELLRTLPHILDGFLTPKPQDDTLATYCQLLQKTDGSIGPATSTAQEAERKVRAYAGFPKTRTEINGQSIVITKAHISDIAKTPLDVTFSDGSILSIDELIAPSGKLMNADAFLRGYAA